jgi:hypothetical protein
MCVMVLMLWLDGMMLLMMMMMHVCGLWQPVTVQCTVSVVDALHSMACYAGNSFQSP